MSTWNAAIFKHSLSVKPYTLYISQIASRLALFWAEPLRTTETTPTPNRELKKRW